MFRVHENYILEKWEELLNEKLILKKKELFFRDYFFFLSGTAIGNT